MKKNFNRFKATLNQAVGRSEKSEALNTADLQSAYTRFEKIDSSLRLVQKEINKTIKSKGCEENDKRLKKIESYSVHQCMKEASSGLESDSILGDVLSRTSEELLNVAKFEAALEIGIESEFLTQLKNLGEGNASAIRQLKSKVQKYGLDYDSARDQNTENQKQLERLQTQQLQNPQRVAEASSRADQSQETLDEAQLKLNSARDELTQNVYNYNLHERDYATYLLTYVKQLQSYHQSSAAVLERLVPQLHQKLSECKSGPVFGTSLDDHLTSTGRKIALPIEVCISLLNAYALEEEGLFRIAGGQNRLKRLKSALDSGHLGDVREYERDVHCLSSCLKLYLRDLPEPLLHSSLYNQWIEVDSITDWDAKMKALYSLIHQMPETNQDNLRYLLVFLHKISTNHEKNKMTTSNLSTVIAPNLLTSSGDQVDAMIRCQTSVTSIVEIMISNVDWFFSDLPELQFPSPDEILPPLPLETKEPNTAPISPSVFKKHHHRRSRSGDFVLNDSSTASPSVKSLADLPTSENTTADFVLVSKKGAAPLPPKAESPKSETPVPRTRLLTIDANVKPNMYADAQDSDNDDNVNPPPKPIAPARRNTNLKKPTGQPPPPPIKVESIEEKL